MVKDVIREYDEHFPEIIERATYTLEKVSGGMGGVGQPAALPGSVPALCALEASRGPPPLSFQLPVAL